jgi:hypothetical protein
MKKIYTYFKCIKTYKKINFFVLENDSDLEIVRQVGDNYRKYLKKNPDI